MSVPFVCSFFVLIEPFYSPSNSFLNEKGLPLPKATSTGTTIVGCLFRDGIVLGADTRATEGEIVADKNCEKVRERSLPSSVNNGSHSVLFRFTTSPTLFDAAVPAQLPTQNSLQPSFHQIWNFMLCRQAVNHGWSLQ